MNYRFIFFVTSFLLFMCAAQAQTHIETYSVCDKSFIIKCEPQIDNSIKVSVFDGVMDSLKLTYKIWTNNTEVFAKTFVNRFVDSVSLNDSCERAEKQNLLIYARELLKNYTTSLQNTIPSAGILVLRDSIKIHKIYYDSTGKLKDTGTTTVNYKVSRLQAEINDGYLENLVAYISNGAKTLRFTLPFPVGMATVGNFRKYTNTNLFLLESPYTPVITKIPKFFLKLNELIDYDYFLGVKRRDYSPKDTAIDIQGGNSITLHKEETKKLFEARIFTDLEGLNDKKPNGLIQTEISKRININTVQHLSNKLFYPLFGSFGFFQYAKPSITLSKLENHNKNMNLSNLDSVRLNPGATDITSFNKNYTRYANALSLFRYQWLSAGADLNLFYVNNHELKYDIHLNVGARLGITQITDSLTNVSGTTITKTGFVNEYSINTIQLYPEIAINFLPEERFSFSLSHRFIYFKPISPTVQLVAYDKDNQSKLLPKVDTWLNTTELLMSVQVNPNSKLFGRLRLNWEAGNAANNFSQIQLGYSTYILGNK